MKLYPLFQNFFAELLGWRCPRDACISGDKGCDPCVENFSSESWNHLITVLALYRKNSPLVRCPRSSWLQYFFLPPLPPGIGFIAGSLTGSFAEVATNYPDRVKTLMQTKKTSMWDACREAARDPFRGALWAGVRKGAIRGLNWGTVGLYTTLFEEWYWKYKRVEAVL